MRSAWAWRIGIVVALAMQLTQAQSARTQSAQPSASEVDRRVESLLSQMTLDEKLSMLGGHDNMYSEAIPRLGIPSLKMSDGPTGVRVYGPSTAYTAGIALAASWDESLDREVGVAMGRDAPARGVHVILAPGMNIYRAPMNGRNFEYFGEDPSSLPERPLERLKGFNHRPYGLLQNISPATIRSTAVTTTVPILTNARFAKSIFPHSRRRFARPKSPPSWTPITSSTAFT